MADTIHDTDSPGSQTVVMASSTKQRAVPKPVELISRHMDIAKKDEWMAIADRAKPLELLDLPVDILQSILREVTHTNDLTALALTHSSLHDLVTPHIYSRFDIVWPEASTHIETRVGVDALTYGLATLVMAPDVFGEAPYQQYQDPARSLSASASEKSSSIRRGNLFAQYTKKFSLGNGPADWVQEYLITKEGGKMLGTLVALAVGRMRNLEAFIWDMPTGVLRDVWLALASLGNREDGQPCRLEKVWVRWHDNSDQGPLASPPPPGVAPAPQPPNIPSMLVGPASSLFQIPAYPRVEFPTFSILSPLKSLNVLDIDELPYAEEMSVLIERSLPVLRELRVGVAQHAQFDMWARPSEDRTLIIPPQLMPVDATVPRPGGLLGILVSRFCEQYRATNSESISDRPDTRLHKSETNIEELAVPVDEESTIAATPTARKPADPDNYTTQMQELSQVLEQQSLKDSSNDEPLPLNVAKRGQDRKQDSRKDDPMMKPQSNSMKSKRLQLDILELERIYLSTKFFSRAIDWSRLMTLTLLGCRNHEQLWKELRKQFTPLSRSRTPSSSSRSVSTSLAGLFSSSRNSTPSAQQIPAEEYTLKLRRLHTDSVSPALIAFIKDALAPDSLEWLFLQESTSYKSPVSIDMIYKGAVKRHRGSLKKLLIDSEVRKEDESVPASWKRWLANRELLTCITGGKMQLRELGMSIDYKDWHFFLQRLPSATMLRSVHIPHLAEHVHGTVDSREAALQVLDIVSLRPEMALCYLGIQKQCFEVLEYTASRRGRSPSGQSASVMQSGLDSDDNDDPEEHAVHDDSDLEMGSSAGEETEDEERHEGEKPSFRLREILFYDDKVSIYRARHGKL